MLGKKLSFVLMGVAIFFFINAFLGFPGGSAYPVEILDEEGNRIVLNRQPSRVVSLIPSVTEIIFRIGAGDRVLAITYHSTYPPETAKKAVIGGFFSPSVKAIQAAKPDVLCVVDFGQMIGRAVRELAPHQTFNLHGSILPALRGAAPINWAIINGDPRTGLTTFRVVGPMDAGPIYLTCETDIRPDETAEDLKARLAALGAQLVCETLDLLASGQAQPREQDHSLKTLAPKLTKADGQLDFATDAASIRNRIHGTWPWPGGQTRLQRACGKTVDVVIARAAATEGDAGQDAPGAFTDDLTVQTGQGRLAIAEIKPAGKKLMPFADFVNGYRVAPGDRFVTIEDDHGC